MLMLWPRTPQELPVVALARPTTPLPSGLALSPKSPFTAPVVELARPWTAAVKVLEAALVALMTATVSEPLRAKGTAKRAGSIVPVARLAALRLVRPAPEPMNVFEVLVRFRVAE